MSLLNISYESSGKLFSPLGRLSFSLGWQELELILLAFMKGIERNSGS